MTKFICKLCNYSTDRLYNMKMHKKTKKHLAKIEESKKESKGILEESNLDSPIKTKKVIRCRFCEKVYSTYSNRAKHEKKCNNTELEKENIKLKKKLEEVEKSMSLMFNSADLVSYMNDKNIDIKQPIHIHQHINTTNYNNSNNKTVNLTGVRYASKHYNDAPLLRFQKNDTSSLLFETEKKEIEDEEYDDEKSNEEFEIEDLDEKENSKFVGNVKYYHDKNGLIRVFTNFIIRYYKKEDKSKQSLHVIDSSRQKFIYTKLEKGLNKIRWVEDPKGYNVGRIIIIPIINYTIHQVELYRDRLSDKIVELSKNDGMDQIKNHTDELVISVKLAKYLKDNKEKIKWAVIKEITPIFHLSDIIIKD